MYSSRPSSTNNIEHILLLGVNADGLLGPGARPDKEEDIFEEISDWIIIVFAQSWKETIIFHLAGPDKQSKSSRSIIIIKISEALFNGGEVPAISGPPAAPLIDSVDPSP